MRIVDVKAGFAHCQIVVGEVVTIVDAGDAKAILAALDRESIALGDVRRIIITHGDGDHWSGANELRERTGAEIVAHEAERGYLEGTFVPRFSLPKRLLIRSAPRRARPRVDRGCGAARCSMGSRSSTRPATHLAISASAPARPFSPATPSRLPTAFVKYRA